MVESNGQAYVVGLRDAVMDVQMQGSTGKVIKGGTAGVGVPGGLHCRYHPLCFA